MRGDLNQGVALLDGAAPWIEAQGWVVRVWLARYLRPAAEINQINIHQFR